MFKIIFILLKKKKKIQVTISIWSNGAFTEITFT